MELLNKQLQGKVFNTWSPTGKAQNLEFTVISVDNEKIVFQRKEFDKRPLYRAAAEHFFENWDSYKQRNISRKELGRNNFNTSYLSGIINKLEDKG